MAKKNGYIRKSNGQWSIPGGAALPGQLIVDYEQGSILLEIYRTIDIEGNDADILLSSLAGVRSYFVDIIWGTAGEDVTLFQCSWVSSEGIGAGLSINRYAAEFLITGIHLDKGFHIKAAKLRYPFLGGFYFGFDFLRLPVEGYRPYMPEGFYDKRIVVNESLTFNIKSDAVDRLEDFFNTKRIEIQDHVTFEYNTEVPFRQLMIDALTFKRLLEFSYGQTLPFQVRLIFPADSELETKRNNKMIFREFEKNGFPVTNFNLNEAKEIPMGTLNQNKMLLSKWTISHEELVRIIQCWFKQTRMKNIVEYYLETANEYGGEPPRLTSVMINNRFLNLVQALEDYYREELEQETVKNDRKTFEGKKNAILMGIKDAHLKQWLNNTFKFTRYVSLEDKLQAIVDHARPVLEKVFTPLDWSHFPKASKDLRHTLSHGMNKNSYLGLDLYLNYYMAKLLLAVCLLQSLGINPLFYRGMFQTNEQINSLFGEIITRQKAKAERAAAK